MLLQTTIQNITGVSPDQIGNPSDSIRMASKAMIEEVTTDPAGFAEKVIDHLIQFGLKVLAALAIYIIGAWIIRRVKKNLAKLLTRRKTEKTLASFISSLVSILLTIMLILVTVSALGINTTSLAAILGAGAVALGMALSGTMENFAGGLIILIFKPFKVGDYISAQGFGGFVTDVTMVSTKILTYDNRSVIIPNGLLSNGTIDNFSQHPVRRVEWKVSMAYGVDAEGCMKALMDVLESDPRILRESSAPGAKDPVTALSEMAESTVVFVARAWVRSEDYWPVMFDINKTIYTTLPEQGYHFAYPHMDITVKS